MNKLFSDIPDVDFMSEAIRLLQMKKPVVLLFLGPNGYGKTTTIAKITHQLMKRGGYTRCGQPQTPTGWGGHRAT